LTDSTEKRRRPLHHWQVTTPGVVAGTAEHLLSKAPFAELKHGLTYQAVPIVPEKLT
jgi:hypothetical protein